MSRSRGALQFAAGYATGTLLALLVLYIMGRL